MKSIGPDEFFKKVAVNSGISDLVVVRDVFYGIIRTISQELRARHSIKLPDWGEFLLKVYKSRNIVGIQGKRVTLPPKPMVKFIPDYKVKRYFYTLGEEGTVIK